MPALKTPLDHKLLFVSVQASPIAVKHGKRIVVVQPVDRAFDKMDFGAEKPVFFLYGKLAAETAKNEPRLVRADTVDLPKPQVRAAGTSYYPGTVIEDDSAVRDYTHTIEVEAPKEPKKPETTQPPAGDSAAGAPPSGEGSGAGATGDAGEGEGEGEGDAPAGDAAPASDKPAPRKPKKGK